MKRSHYLLNLVILSVLIVNSCEGKGIEKRNLVEKNDENGLQNGEGN